MSSTSCHSRCPYLPSEASTCCQGSPQRSMSSASLRPRTRCTSSGGGSREQETPENQGQRCDCRCDSHPDPIPVSHPHEGRRGPPPAGSRKIEGGLSPSSGRPPSRMISSPARMGRTRYAPWALLLALTGAAGAPVEAAEPRLGLDQDVSGRLFLYRADPTYRNYGFEEYALPEFTRFSRRNYYGPPGQLPDPGLRRVRVAGDAVVDGHGLAQVVAHDPPAGGASSATWWPGSRTRGGRRA